jgi:hypothetical protein
MKIVAFLVLAFALVAVSGSVNAEPSQGSPAGKDFGAGITLEQPTGLAQVVQQPERFTEQPVLLRGRIVDVCQHKGCWTLLRDGEATVRVRFKDYGFFLPTDCVGEEALVEGVVMIEMVSEETARHHASESRFDDPSRVEGPQRELTLTASGVRLLGRD